MQNLSLWFEAIEDELDKVSVSGKADIATMSKVFNTLQHLKEEAKSEADDEQGQ